MSEKLSIRAASCADDYDPNSMSVDQARRFIHQFLTPVAATERVHIRSALDRVLAEDVISPVNVPSHVNSAMDGYALRAADLPAEGDRRFTVAGTSFAGRPYTGTVGAAQCVRIMTGAVVPEGLDTIVIQEHVQRDGDAVLIDGNHKKGQHVRFAGEDLAIGQVALQRGQIVRPAELGLLASLGVNEVTVFRKLRVAFFSTGDELKSIGSILEEGQIYDSNRYTLYGMLKRMNIEAIDMGVAPDVPEALERTLLEAAACADVVITSGGVSVGEADFIKDLLDRHGEVVFWKIAMKPGRPLAYGKIAGAHFFGLPGNPVSVMVTFYQFVRTALQVLMGINHPKQPPVFAVPCVTPLKKVPGRTEFQRGILQTGTDGALMVAVTGNQGSGILRSMSEANCFIILPEAQGNVAEGDLVQVQLFEGII